MLNNNFNFVRRFSFERVDHHGANQTNKNAKSERQFDFVESFEMTAGAWRLKINYAEYFEGETAERAAKADKADYSPAELSGIYIRDNNPLVRSLKVSDRAQIFLLRDLKLSKVTPVNFAKLMRGENAGLPQYWGLP